ncbi:MAG: ATP-binding protein [Ferruginibacter sp.]
MTKKPKKIQRIFLIYWVLLAYIVAALIFWFFTLNKQNQLMSELKMSGVIGNGPLAIEQRRIIKTERDRKVSQYLGEGATFFLVILAGALFVFRAVRRQLSISQEQQNFMMAVTHELKTPIAVAKLNLETMQKRKLDEHQQQRLLFNTLQETNRLDALCNNMLIASQIDAGGYRMEKQELNLGELVEACAEDFNIRFPQRHIQTTAHEAVYVTGDALLLKIVTNNLLDNALKYSPKDSLIEAEVLQNDSVAEIRIKDNGPGIEDEEKKKVFDKFYRLGNEATKRSKGTGLGLYLSKKIIQNHGGNIFIQNNTEGGSIFTIQIASPD